MTAATMTYTGGQLETSVQNSDISKVLIANEICLSFLMCIITLDPSIQRF